jgi:uridine kinase
MRGDILIIGENHRRAAAGAVRQILPDILEKKGIYLITVAGESGAGKSEVAESIADRLKEEGIMAFVIQQDDYFVYPPKTNAEVRRKNINLVGTGEVRLDLLNEEIRQIASGAKQLVKPLVIFAEDRIAAETIDLKNIRVVIIEGTYTTLLKDIDCRIFIDRDINDTRADRLRRNREQQDDYLEQILMIEHRIISAHKQYVDIIISKDFNAYKNNAR